MGSSGSIAMKLGIKVLESQRRPCAFRVNFCPKNAKDVERESAVHVVIQGNNINRIWLNEDEALKNRVIFHSCPIGVRGRFAVAVLCRARSTQASKASKAPKAPKRGGRSSHVIKSQSEPGFPLFFSSLSLASKNLARHGSQS